MIVGKGEISSAMSFSILAGIKSGPLALCGLSFRGSFLTPSSVMAVSSMELHMARRMAW